MTPKQLLFREEARDKIRCGVDALAEAVKVTLVPRGRTVILDRDFGPLQIVNSGVLVAKSVDLGLAMRVKVSKKNTAVIGDPNTVEAIGERPAGIRKVRGAASETVLKERRIRVEDGLLATRAAIEGRVVPGDVEATMPNL